MDCWIRTLLVFLAIFVPQAKAADKITYFVPDHAGSPVVAMDEKGEVLWRAHRDPWGARLDNEGPETRSPGYAGHAEDAESNLVYMGARWYEPASGRFTGVDPVGFAVDSVQTFNRYAYANNAPYVFYDPDGRAAVGAGATMLAVAGIYVARDTATSAALSAVGVPDIPFSISGLSRSIGRKGVGDFIEGPTVLWAGGDKAKDAANDLANALGGKTLGMTKPGSDAAAALAGKSYVDARPIWANLSRNLAEDAKGIVHVVLNDPAVRRTSLLLTDELPAALKNNKVTGFIFYHLE